MSLRSRGGTAAHEGWALLAASSACMPSAGEASATSASTCLVEGSSTVNVAPVSAGRQAPPMNSPFGTAPTTFFSRARSIMVGPPQCS